ncbi:MAG TPA: PDZ domain-containing protein [Pyrinomonadaceae bacterium]|nr:PDZ domain-containing protein [Pyrinomonadaceae bacterium]
MRSRLLKLSGSAALAFTLLAAPALARQSSTAPTAPAQPAPVAVAPVAAPAVPTRAQAVTQTPRQAPAAKTPPAGPVGRTPRLPAPARVAPPAPAAAPRQVVTVVHRLGGWKLLMWLAATGPTALEIDALPSANDVHTNIVAGYVNADGRSVVARLPQAVAEVEAAATPQLPPGFQHAGGLLSQGRSEFMLVTYDNKHVKARFVGLDASTGLSVLEAAEPILDARPFGEEGSTEEDPAVGQLVRFYAPVPVAKAGSQPALPAPPGESFIYLNVGQAVGRLTEIQLAPTGRPARFIAQSPRANPAWTGAVAATPSGDMVGIVSQSTTGETQIVPVESVRRAVERVRAARKSVPQPWLGVRGDAAFHAPLTLWESTGWNTENARGFIENRRGVLLTSVAPGTPAFAAGLRPGDVISRVGAREVRVPEDLSFFLKDAGVGANLDFTVFRPLEAVPMKFQVQLSGAQNPALATADFEMRAARTKLVESQTELRSVRAAEQSLRTAPAAVDAAELARLSARMREIERKMEEARALLKMAERRLSEAHAPAGELFAFPPSAEGAFDFAASPLHTFGFQGVGLTPRGASHLGAAGGLLVVSVRPEGPAAAGGLKAGDVVETVNGQKFTRDQLRRSLLGPAPVTIGVVRGGQRRTLTLALASDSKP